jgi:hypothetical protein
MCKTLGRNRMWIGIVFIPNRIRIDITLESRIQIGINTMPIHTLEPTNLSACILILCRVYIPVVRSHAAVDHAYVVGDLFYLAGGLVLEQDGLVLLLSGQNHSVHGLDKRH